MTFRTLCYWVLLPPARRRAYAHAVDSADEALALALGGALDGFSADQS